MSLELKDDDLFVLTLKDVKNRGRGMGNNRYFEVHLYNKDENRFQNITHSISELTGLTYSQANGTYGTLIVSGDGQNMSNYLMDKIYKNHNEIHGISSKEDYYNTGKIVLNVANKDNKADIEQYKLISNPEFKPNLKELNEIVNAESKHKVIPQVLEKNGLSKDKDYFTNNPSMYKFSHEELRDDKEFAMTMVNKIFTHDLKHISDRLKDDKDFISKVVSNHSFSLEIASDRLKDDKDVVLKAVTKSGYALNQASDRLKNDKEIVLEAVKQDNESIRFASKKIQDLCNDKDPIIAIKTEISKEYAEKLQNELSKKQELRPTKKMKI